MTKLMKKISILFISVVLLNFFNLGFIECVSSDTIVDLGNRNQFVFMGCLFLPL